MASVSHSLPSLEITAAPDDMEITSELGIFDNDADIDLDLTGEYHGDPDGDFILEDVASEVGKAPSVQDQEMNQEEITYGEEDVTFDDAGAEDAGFVFDEDLTDVNIESQGGGDIGHMNENVKSQGESIYILETPAEGFEAAAEEYPQLSREPPHISLEHDVQHETQQSSAIVDGPEGVQVHDFPTEEQNGSNLNLVDDAGQMPGPNQAVEFPSEHTVDDLHNATRTASPHLELKPDAQDATDTMPPNSGHAAPADHTNVDEFVPSATGANQLGQDPPEKDTQGEFEEEHSPGSHFHSTIAVFEGEEMYLFRSHEKEQPDACLLQDASLISRSIYDLLQACRGALGDSISEEQELQIEVHDLDLIIGEESAHALSISFSEILEVYLSLYSLDGVDQPSPLYVTLSTKKKFSARLGFLRAAIADGCGMSQLWYNRADEEYSDEQADPTGEDQGTTEATEQPHEGEASSLAALGENVYSTDVQNVPAENSTDVAATEQDPSVSINADARPGDDLVLENEAGKLHEIQNVLVTTDEETRPTQEEDSTGNSAVRIAQQSTRENPSGENTAYSFSDPHTETGSNAATGDDGLIDYGDQDEHHSTDSSTIVGDGSNAQHDAKVQAASETGPDAASPAEGQSAWIMQPHDQGRAHEDLGFQYEDGDQDVNQGENQEQCALDGDFSAPVGENEFNYDIGEDEDGDHAQDEAYEGGDDRFDDGARFNTDEINWEDPVAENTHPEQHAAINVPHEDNADQRETWDDFLESEQPLDQGEPQPTEDASGPTLDVQSQSAASAETLVGGANTEEPLEQADEVTFDDIDEITYGEEDEDASGLQALSGDPNESPPGKRSFTEHLEGDRDDDSETAVKRLRSI